MRSESRSLTRSLFPEIFDDRVVERVVNRVEGFAALLALQDVFEPVEILRRGALRGPVRRLPFEKLPDLHEFRVGGVGEHGDGELRSVQDPVGVF